MAQKLVNPGYSTNRVQGSNFFTNEVEEIGSTNNTLWTTLKGSNGNEAEINELGQLHTVQEGMQDDNNSTAQTLLADEEWFGAATNTLGYHSITIVVNTDQDSAIKGMKAQFSCNAVDWYDGEEYTVLANSPTGAKFFTPPVMACFFRIYYKNGSTAQNRFRVITTIKKQSMKWSSHNIEDPITDQDDAQLVKAVPTGKSELTGDFENVNTFRQALNVNTALVHKIGIAPVFRRFTGDATTLVTAVNAGDYELEVLDVTGFVVGSQIIIYDDTNFVFELGRFGVTAVDVANDILTLDTRLTKDFVATTTKVEEVEVNLATANGTMANPVIFTVEPFATGSNLSIYQLTRGIFQMTHALEADDTKFGGINALTNGLVFRSVNGDTGAIRNLGNFKANKDFKLSMNDVEYTDKAGGVGSQYGTRGKWSFVDSEFIAELNGDNGTGDRLELLVQDDLTALDEFRVRVQGRVFGG